MRDPENSTSCSYKGSFLTKMTGLQHCIFWLVSAALAAGLIMALLPVPLLSQTIEPSTWIQEVGSSNVRDDIFSGTLIEDDLIVAGSRYTESGFEFGWIARLEANGHIISESLIIPPPQGHTKIQRIVKSEDGDLLVVGSIADQDDSDIFMLCMAYPGETLWKHVLSTEGDDMVGDVISTNDGAFSPSPQSDSQINFVPKDEWEGW